MCYGSKTCPAQNRTNTSLFLFCTKKGRESKLQGEKRLSDVKSGFWITGMIFVGYSRIADFSPECSALKIIRIDAEKAQPAVDIRMRLTSQLASLPGFFTPLPASLVIHFLVQQAV